MEGILINGQHYASAKEALTHQSALLACARDEVASEMATLAIEALREGFKVIDTRRYPIYKVK